MLAVKIQLITTPLEEGRSVSDTNRNYFSYLLSSGPFSSFNFLNPLFSHPIPIYFMIEGFLYLLTIIDHYILFKLLIFFFDEDVAIKILNPHIDVEAIKNSFILSFDGYVCIENCGIF